MLKKVLKDGAEQPGIDHLYFQSQEEKFKEYQKNRESACHPRPLGMGVLMWDEVKIFVNLSVPETRVQRNLHLMEWSLVGRRLRKSTVER